MFSAGCARGLGLALLLVAGVRAQTARVSEGDVAGLTPAGARALMVYFVASDCPVSNRYFPEMERLAARFAGQGVATRYVYANATETTAGVGRHQVEFGAPVSEVRMDPAGALVRATGATATPEAVLLLHEGPAWRVAYRGRIDDRYVHIGVERPRAERHDLVNAVVAALAHQPVMPPGGPVVGCGIVTGPAVKQALGAAR